MVYPGQTFDNALPVDREVGGITSDALARTVEAFHRRNEEARLIEARSQEPFVRGVRLKATGLVDHPNFSSLPVADPPSPISRRRVHTGGSWHDDVPVYDGDALGADVSIDGPAVLQSRFTTLILRPGDRATVQTAGDVVVDIT
jgi:N-methylhydantoinase A